MTGLNHNEIEREILYTLKTLSVDNDFVFNLPLEIEAKTDGITYGVGVQANFYNDTFYMQMSFGDFKKSRFIQIGFKLLIGEITVDVETYELVNELNTKLLYAKAVINKEGNYPYLTIEHDFNAANLEQVNESIYDFLNDLVDDDITPLIEKALSKMRE